MKKFRLIGVFIAFFLMFTIVGCDLSEEGKQQNELYEKFKEIYNNQEFYKESYTDKYSLNVNSNGITSETINEISYNKTTNEGYSITIENEKNQFCTCDNNAFFLDSHFLRQHYFF